MVVAGEGRPAAQGLSKVHRDHGALGGGGVLALVALLSPLVVLLLRVPGQADTAARRTPAAWPAASVGQKLLLHLFAEWANCFLGRRQHELPLGSPTLGRPEIRWAAGMAGLLPGPGTVSVPADVPTSLAPRAHHTSRAHEMDSSLLKSEPRNELLCRKGVLISNINIFAFILM